MINEYTIKRKYWSIYVEFNQDCLNNLNKFIPNYTYIGYDYYGFMFKKPDTYEMLFVPYYSYLVKDEFGNAWVQKDVEELKKNNVITYGGL